MELRHLRYFLVVGELLNFTKAAARLRVAQPALSRQVQDLEDEIGVDLLRRSPRGVTLTAEGKLFLQEVRELLRRVDESVEKTRALARGEYGELHIGYASVPTAEILPPALEAFRKAVPRVKVVLHDLTSDELIAGLRNATLELALMVEPTGEQGRCRRRYRHCRRIGGQSPELAHLACSVRRATRPGRLAADLRPSLGIARDHLAFLATTWHQWRP